MKGLLSIIGLMLFSCISLKAQNRSLTGLVTDAQNIGIVSATVKVKGQSNITTTNSEGRFGFSVPTGNITLEISSVGYAAREVAIAADENNVTIVLTVSNEELSEVVVTALGIKKQKRVLGYAVGQVKGDDLTKAREINLGTALSGRVAGVNASGMATGPGGSSRVVIRGATSASGNNQPLYVIDGIPIDNTQQGNAGRWGGVDRGDGLSSFNPDDIADISVLKGSNASALYGSRGSNGVILITTKKGRAGQGIGVEFNSNYTMDKVLKTTDWQYEYGAGNLGEKPPNLIDARDRALFSWGAKLDGSQVLTIDGNMHPYSAQKDNLKNFYDNGKTWSNTLALFGGGNNINYRFSVGNVKNNAILPNAGFDRQNFALSLNATPNKKITIETNGQYIIEKANNRPFLSDAPKNANLTVYQLATNIDVRWLKPGVDSTGGEAKHLGSNVFQQTPYFATDYVKNKDRRNRFIGSTILTYNITPQFYAKGKFGIDYINYEYWEIEPTGIQYRPTGSMNIVQQSRYEYNTEGQLGYKNKVFTDFDVNVIVGANRQHNRRKGTNYGGSEFIVPFQYFYGNIKNKSSSEDFAESEVNSVFASADIGYKNFAFLSLTGREDWFSTLSPESNHIFYPSINTSIVYSDIVKLPSWWSYGKLRAGWGSVGGGLPDAYALVLTYTPVGQGYFGQPLVGTNGGNIPNANLQPYEVKTIEIGAENSFLKNRLSIDFAWYNKKTINDIADANVSISSGYGTTKINVGEIQNRGIELQISGIPVRTKDFSWNAGFNMAHNKSKVVKLTDELKSKTLADNRDGNAFVVLEEGEPFGIIKAYVYERDSKGDLVYNSDGTLRRGQLVTVGKGVSPFTMGFTSDLTYKNFILSVLVDGKFGGDVFSSTNYLGYRLGLHKGTLPGRQGGIPVSGADPSGAPVNVTVPAQLYWRSWAFGETAHFLYSSDFIKLRSVSLGYSVPKKILNKTPIQGINISLVARNLANFLNKVPNVDPESNYQNGNEQGLERGGVPVTRSYGINLNVKF
ncbi:SusC/RagA family TonB-linked outer membrane protein [Terrimonas pollutisoli]|uniref:SusC/RagA family TonB-linked outer membrane protein n=1 Tax=Terrimonas pollutisoli TaxID=3034147 RepID=UPI0023ED367A|nr:SusC/RagA family TonB-linked outer membrane protein [Terrimonas sp. H1YJ31]